MTHTNERWMLDYRLTKNGLLKWVRMPALTWNAVMGALHALQSAQIYNEIHRKAELDWSSIRIQKESDLDELVDEDGNEVKWTNKEPVCTLRQTQFGSLYHGLREDFLNGRFDPMTKDYKDLEDPLYTFEEFKDWYPELDWEVLEEVA